MNSWIVRTNDFKFYPLIGLVAPCTRKSLALQSLKKISIFWGLAVVCVFIPVLHFFLVPGFFIAGVYAFLKQFKNTHFLEEGHYRCPSCDDEGSVKNFYFHEDSRLSCSRCARQLVVKPAADLAL